jgi:hypothetical protein
MTTELLKKKTKEYIFGQPVNEEVIQLQSLFSFTTKLSPEEEERKNIENEIVNSVNAYVTSSTLVPKTEQPWWKKIMAF